MTPLRITGLKQRKPYRILYWEAYFGGVLIDQDANKSLLKQRYEGRDVKLKAINNMRKEITQELVKSLFDYHEDGYLIWKVPTRGRIVYGAKAGFMHDSGDGLRNMVGVNGSTYKLARVIFLYHKGYMPKEVDHIDVNKLNDRIGNLREADRSQQNANRNAVPTSTSKYLGVVWDKSRNKWKSSIGVNKRTLFIGRYENEHHAALAYNREAIRHYGEFANPNIIMV